MAKLIAEMATEHAGEILCGELIRRGYDPVQLNVFPGGDEAMIVLRLHGTWCKGVKLQRAQLVPEAVEFALETWKMKVRKDLIENRPSEVIKAAVRQFGMAAVDRALAPKVAIA